MKRLKDWTCWLTETPSDLNQSKSFAQLALPLGVLLLVFVIFKLPELGLPYYWDEAWSYIPALHAMSENGPSLLPGVIAPELSRGHPLAFYAAAGGWMKLFGSEPWVMRIYPLLLSMLTLSMTAWLGWRMGGVLVGLAAAALLAAQMAFFTQSLFLLPEVQLALLATAALAGWTLENYALYAVAGSLLLLTKESGLAFVAAALAAEGLRVMQARFRRGYGRLLLTALPLLPAALFFMMQKQVFGWHFFPDHMGYVEESSFEVFLDRFNSIASFVFLERREGWALLGFGIMGFALSWLRPSSVERRFWTMTLLLVAALAGFSAFNFLTGRYLIFLYPALCLAAMLGLARLTIRLSRIAFAVLALSTLGLSAASCYDPGNHNDTNMGYADMVRAHVDMTRFCEKEQLHDHPIATHFLMLLNLSDKRMGYLAPDGRPFQLVNLSPLDPRAEYLLISDIECSSDLVALKDDTLNYRQVFHAHQGEADCWLLAPRDTATGP